MRLSLLATLVAQAVFVTAQIPPRQDPWYAAPAGFESRAPGTVLKIRPAPGDLSSEAGANSTYNVLYRTTDSQYRPAWAVTTVFVPKTPVNALLSYQIPYDSADVDASPSYALYQSVQDDIKNALAKGQFVTVPDYEGPLASFTAGVISGHATIDAVRATLSLRGISTLTFNSNTRYALWGYSGGALASEWAAELQADYAPEMRFAGAALGGLTPNITAVLLAINKGYAVGLAPNAILGLTSQFPEIQEYVISRLKPTGLIYNRSNFLRAWNNTLAESIVDFLFQDISKYFVGGFDDLLGHQPTLAVINSNGIMGQHGAPRFPLFVYKAIKDNISPVEDTDELVAQFCAQGADIEYIRNTRGGHTAEGDNGRPNAVAFLDAVLAGTYVTGRGCSIRDVTQGTNISPLKNRQTEEDFEQGEFDPEEFARRLLPGWH